MSKIKLLLDVVLNLQTLADSVAAVAQAMESNTSEEKPVPTEEKTISIAPKVTLEQVRAVLAAKSHEGFTAEVRGLLEKHGAVRLSDIDPGEYPALLKEAEALSDG